MSDPYKVTDSDDLEVSGRILNVLDMARRVYKDGNNSENWRDAAVNYILTGDADGCPSKGT